MATLLLVRHAMCDPVGQRLAGRMQGIPLNATGRAQASHVARQLAREPIAAVYTSPRERARETATAVALASGCPVVDLAGLDELDFGQWTGRSFHDLQSEPEWQRFNTHRSTARVPGGESMLQAQARAVAVVESLREPHSGETAVLVSHLDILRSVIAHYLGMPLDHLLRIEIAPASLCELSLEPWGDRIVRMNCQPSRNTSAADPSA